MNKSKKTESGPNGLSAEVCAVVQRLRESRIPFKAIHFIHDPDIASIETHYLDDRDPDGGYTVQEPLAYNTPYLIIALDTPSQPVGFVPDVDEIGGQ